MTSSVAAGLGAALAGINYKMNRDNTVLAVPRNHNFPWRWYPSYKNMPDLKKHHNIMAQVMSTPLYADLYKLSTPNGFTVDHVIQTGVDNPGHPHILTVGAVAGDEETYEVFAPLLDQIIELRHNGYCPEDKHPTTLPSKDEEDEFFGGIDGGIFDETYVLSVRVRTGTK
jgi:creatine kinase